MSCYLRLASGPSTLDLLALAPNDLRGTLDLAISRANRALPMVTTALCKSRMDGATLLFTIAVRFIESDGDPHDPRLLNLDQAG